MFQTLEILDSLHTKFQSGVFIADDHGVRVHLEARDGPHMVDTFFDALGESEGLVATVDNDNNFTSIHDGANTDGESSLGDLGDIVIEETRVSNDGVVSLQGYPIIIVESINLQES